MTKGMLPPTSKRVQYHTKPDVNLEIREQAIGGLYELMRYKSTPLPAIRKTGVRTAGEINSERMALKMMRGDFSEEPDSVEEMLENIEK